MQISPKTTEHLSKNVQAIFLVFFVSEFFKMVTKGLFQLFRLFGPEVFFRIQLPTLRLKPACSIKRPIFPSSRRKEGSWSTIRFPIVVPIICFSLS